MRKHIFDSRGYKFGWQVGDDYFTNKFKAVRHAMYTKESYKAYLMDSEWDKHDWTIEPNETVEELQRQRALELRDKYDTIGLCYGGGTDCHTTLLTFIENKIPLDYIFVWYVGPDPDTKWNQDTQLAIKYLEENKDKLLGAKVLYDRKIDYYEGNCIFSHKPGEDISKRGYQLRMYHHGYTSTVEIRHPEIYKEIQKNGCVLTGSNKPFVYKDENGYYSQYIDEDDESWGEGYYEMFYLGSAPLIIKTSHLAKQWLIDNPQYTETNEIYKTPNRDGVFKDLNERFGRIFMHERFHIKPTMVNLSYLEDDYLGTHKWNDDVTLYRWAQEWPNWHGSNSYKDLVNCWKIFLTNKQFTNNGNQLTGWLCEKRYLE